MKLSEDKMLKSAEVFQILYFHSSRLTSLIIKKIELHWLPNEEIYYRELGEDDGR